ncbi:MAG: DUF4360 domain-containing protein [Deltaproteobacteria bacterium]|nr:DUF4360 domain-containing protein [Deltaproteobacteria bacterium]
MMIRSRAATLAVALICVLGYGASAPSLASAACGDGVLDAGEACDDGNPLDGDCCSSTCQWEAPGSACADDGERCTRDVCDGTGACVHDASPLTTCLVAPRGKLQILNDADDAKDKLILQMQNAPGLTPADFGDPTSSDGYRACIFGPQTLLMSAEIAPGGTCDGKPCWAETTGGYTYKDKRGTRDGITLLALKASAKPKTKINAKGLGAHLADAPLPFPAPVMAQIVNGTTGQCFETYFLEPTAVKRNTATDYDAKAAAPGFEIPGIADVIRQDDLAPGTPSPNGETPRGAEPGPDATKVYVESITSNGNGCADGSIVTSLTPDRSGFTLLMDGLVASKGPGVPLTEAARTCQVNLNLKLPQGWQYSIGTVDHRGRVAIPKKMKATQRATYYFEGDGELASADTTFVGPLDKQYLIRDTLPFSSVSWSSCENVRPLTITTELQLRGGADLGQISADTLDGKIAFVLGLRWRRCP